MSTYDPLRTWGGQTVGVIHEWNGKLYVGVDNEIWEYDPGTTYWTQGYWPAGPPYGNHSIAGTFRAAFLFNDDGGEWGPPGTDYLVFVGDNGQVAYSSDGVNWNESNPEDEGITDISNFQSGFDDAVNDPGVPYIGDSWDPGNEFPAGDGVNQIAGIWGVYNMGEGGPGGGTGYTATRYAEKIWNDNPWVQLFGGANGGTIWERTDVMPDVWTQRFAGFDPNNDSREGGVVQVFPAAGLLLAGSNGGSPDPEAKLYYWPEAGNMSCRYTAPNDTYIAGFAYDGDDFFAAGGSIDKNVLISEDGGWTWQVDGNIANAPPLGQPIASVGDGIYVAGGDTVFVRGIEEEGWTGKISGVVNPARIMSTLRANIAKVKGYG